MRLIDALAIAALREKAARENPKTNGDRIRAMSDEELAVMFWGWMGACYDCPIADVCCRGDIGDNCKNVWLGWIRQEATHDD